MSVVGIAEAEVICVLWPYQTRPIRDRQTRKFDLFLMSETHQDNVKGVSSFSGGLESLWVFSWPIDLDFGTKCRVHYVFCPK